MPIAKESTAKESIVKESTLFVVSTPIGHLDDMTPRAIEVLRQVSVIAAEDTRHSRKLLNYFGIETPMISCHEHNERRQAEVLLVRLQQGESVALISDAGTPLISDPGFVLVRTVREQGIKVVPVPGACALVAALSVSGLPTDRFYFEGFLPAKSSGRKKRLEALGLMTNTWAVYESTHRILDSLADFREVLGGDRYIVLAREMTKTFETVLAGTVAEVEKILREDANQCRGEFVVLVEGAAEQEEEAVNPETVQLLQRLLQELPAKKAAAVIADVSRYRKKQLYELSLAIKGE